MNVGAVRPELVLVPIGQIDEPALPSRSSMDDEKMSELVASMRAQGFTSAMVLARVDARYEVIAGHRRWHAARLAGIVAVPALVYPSKFDGIEAIQHSENMRREELKPADEAIWFAQLYEKFPEEGTDGVAARCGESRGYVEARIALLSGDEQIFQALERGDIGVGIAQQLNRCTEDLHRRMLLRLAIENGATVALVSGWINEWKLVHEPATRRATEQAAAAPALKPVMADYFTCRVCESKEHPQNMRPIQIHDYCVSAVLEPALAMYQRRSDYVRAPRTFDEAVELVNELCERFPQLAGESAAQP